MLLLIDDKGNYPRFIGDIWVMSPEWKEGDPLPSGWEIVEETTPPQANELQIVEEAPPSKVGDGWVQVWTTRDLTKEELDQKILAGIKIKVMLGEPLTEEEAMLLVF